MAEVAVNEMSGKFCVITTEHRGVFAGIVETVSDDGNEVTLRDARVCVRWGEAVRGWIGLAATGPDETCRISRAAPRLTLRGVTSVCQCTDAARQAWEAEPWK